jgi:hypothetical protein
MTAPAWLTDDEEISVLGDSVDRAEGMDAAQVDALASQLLGWLGREQAEIARYTEAMNAEIERIRMRYNARIEKHQKSAGYLEMQVCRLAESADFGKKKSRDVGNGTYGRRAVAERFAIADKQKVVAWALIEHPEIVEHEPKVSVTALTPIVARMLRETGELPEGVEHHAEYEKSYCKVEAI